MVLISLASVFRGGPEDYILCIGGDIFLSCEQYYVMIMQLGQAHLAGRTH